MPWASDKIRVFYRAGLLNERILGKKMDSRYPAHSRRLTDGLSAAPGTTPSRPDIDDLPVVEETTPAPTPSSDDN